MFEGLFVLGGQPCAQIDKVRARDGDRVLARFLRRHERRIVGQRRIAPHAEIVLDAAFGRKTVVVPAHRIEDGFAAHALIPRDHVGMRVRKHMPHVQRPADRRGRRID